VAFGVLCVYAAKQDSISFVGDNLRLLKMFCIVGLLWQQFYQRCFNCVQCFLSVF